MHKYRFILILIACICSPSFAQFDAGRASISVSINNEIYPYREFGTYVLPQEHLGICLVAEQPERFQVVASHGVLDFINDCRWLWTAPEQPGENTLRVMDGDQVVMTMNVFVMRPASRVVNGRIGSVEIGNYPEEEGDNPIYFPPDGYIEANAEMLKTRVSPHFVLGQFVETLDDRFPKYIVLRERLLLKLEALLERLNELGIDAESLSVIKGYVSPAFNAEIGGMPDSRHMYGGAATVIVDRDRDGRMDDLDGNGLLDDRDGQMLFTIIDDLYSEPGREYLRGGLFLYRADSVHGSSVMLDARGFRKRWPNASDVPPLPANLQPKHKRQFP